MNKKLFRILIQNYKITIISLLLFLIIIHTPIVIFAAQKTNTTIKLQTGVFDTLYNEQAYSNTLREKFEYKAKVISKTTNPISLRLLALKEKYPAGKYWNHFVHNENIMMYQLGCTDVFCESVTDFPCNSHDIDYSVGLYECNYFDGGIQCAGFAFKLFYELYGIYASDVPIIDNNRDIQVGDAVRINIPGIIGHSGIVLSIDGNQFTMAEVNAHGNCMIEWGTNTYDISQIEFYQHAPNYDKLKNMKSLFFPDNTVALNPGRTALIYPFIFSSTEDPQISFEKVKLSVKDPDVIKIDINGKVQAIAPGKTILKAESSDGLLATCNIIVE